MSSGATRLDVDKLNPGVAVGVAVGVGVLVVYASLEDKGTGKKPFANVITAARGIKMKVCFLFILHLSNINRTTVNHWVLTRILFPEYL